MSIWPAPTPEPPPRYVIPSATAVGQFVRISWVTPNSVSEPLSAKLLPVVSALAADTAAAPAPTSRNAAPAIEEVLITVPPCALSFCLNRGSALGELRPHSGLTKIRPRPVCNQSDVVA